MAAWNQTMFPFKAKHFASAFLNPSKNSRGYDGSLLDFDKQIAKGLLRPFPFIPGSSHLGLGAQMQSFVENQLGLHGEQVTDGGQQQEDVADNDLHSNDLGSEQTVETRSLEEDPDVLYTKCRIQASNSSSSASVMVSLSSCDSRQVEVEESANECATIQIPQERGIIFESHNCNSAVPSPCTTPTTTPTTAPTTTPTLTPTPTLASTPTPTLIPTPTPSHLNNETEYKSTTNPSDNEYLDKIQQSTNTQPEQLLPLSLSKKRSRQDQSMDLSELTMTMNLQAITCVVDHHYKTQYRPSPDELNVCGNVAILYGCRSCDSTVTVHYGDVIGVYNYIDGTVKSNLDSMDEEANLVSL